MRLAVLFLANNQFIMNDPKDKYDKVLKFIEMAVLSPKRVRYRDAMSSKHSK